MQQSPSSPGWQGRKVNTPEVRHRWEKAWTSIQNKEFQAPFKKYRRNLILLFIAAILLWLVFVYLLSYAPKKTPVTLISLKNYQSPVPLNLGASQNENGLGSLANLQFLSADGSQKNTDKWQDELAVLTNPNKNQFLKTVKDSFQEDHSLFFKLPRTRIIYINGYAAVNQSGEPCLVLTADNPLKEESWFKLSDLLEELDQATQNKTFQTLLVFDCVKEQENWKLGIVDNNWSESLGNLLEHEDFSGLRSSLTVLCSTSSDEFSHFSPQLGSSVFSHFFKLALAGLADKTNPSGKFGGNNDGQVSVTELERFVTSEVSNYVRTQYGAQQTPAFLNRARNTDFILTWDLDSDNLAELQNTSNLSVNIDLDLVEDCWELLAELKEEGALQFAPQSFSNFENKLLRAEKLGFEDDALANIELGVLKTDLKRIKDKLNPNGLLEISSFVSKSNAFPGHTLFVQSGDSWDSLAMSNFFRDTNEPTEQVAIGKLVSSPNSADQKAKIEALPIQDKFIASHLQQVKRLKLWTVDTQLDNWLNIYHLSQKTALPPDLRVLADIEDSSNLLTQYCRSAFDYLLIGNEVSSQFDSIITKAKALTTNISALSEQRETYYKNLDNAYSEFPYLAQWRIRTHSKLPTATLDRLASVSFSPDEIDTFLSVYGKLENEYQKLVSTLVDKQRIYASDVFEINLILGTPLLKGDERRKLIEQLISFSSQTEGQIKKSQTDSKKESDPKLLTPEQSANHAKIFLSKLLHIDAAQQPINQTSSLIRDSLFNAEIAFPKNPKELRNGNSQLLDQVNFQRKIASLLTKFPTSESEAIDLIFIKRQNALLTKVLENASNNALLDLYGFPVGNVIERLPVFQQLVSNYLKKLKRSPNYKNSKLEIDLQDRIKLVNKGLDVTAKAVSASQSEKSEAVMVELTPAEKDPSKPYSAFPPGVMSLRFSIDQGLVKEGQAFQTLPLEKVSKFDMNGPSDPDRLTATFRGNDFTTRVLSEGFNSFTVDAILETPDTASVVLNGRLRARPSILFALDCSQSMANEIYIESIGDQMTPRLVSARDVLKNLLDDFAQRGDSKIGLRLYGHRIGWSTDEPVRALTQDSYIGEFPDGVIPENDVELVLPIGRYTQSEHTRITKQLDSVKPWGQSPLYLTLSEALKDFQNGDKHENPSIVVITDGLNYQFTPGSELSFATQKTQLKDLLRDIKQLNENGKPVPIYIMGFGISAPEQTVAAEEFRQIEKASGGKYFSFENERDLAKVLEQQLQLGSYQVTPKLVTTKASSDDAYTKKLNEKIDLNARGDYQLTIDGVPDLPFTIEGGESLQFFLGEKPGGLTKIESLPYQTNVIAAAELTSENFLDVWKARIHRPKPIQGGVEFNVSLQSQSNPFSPRPTEIWVELTPKTDSTSSSFSYVFYDRNFELGKSVPLMRLNAQGWNPQLAKQGYCEVFCKWEKSEPDYIKPFSDFLNNQNLLKEKQSAPGIDSLEFEVEIDKVEHAIKIKEFHPSKSGNNLNNTDSEKPPWARFDLTCESQGRPDDVSRRYNIKDQSAVHTFNFSPDAFQRFLDSKKSNIEIQTQGSLKRGAYKLESGKIEFSLDDGQGLLPVDASTSDR